MFNLEDHLESLYDRNPFVRLLEMTIICLDNGIAKLVMPVKVEKHTNLYRQVHGGALAALADTAMGLACATLNKRVVTIEMNINFMRNVGQGAVTAVGKVLHSGRSTCVVEAELQDNDGVLIAKARGTFFVIGEFGNGD